VRPRSEIIIDTEPDSEDPLIETLVPVSNEKDCSPTFVSVPVQESCTAGIRPSVSFGEV